MFADEFSECGPNSIGFVLVVERGRKLLELPLGLRIHAGLGQFGQLRFCHGPFVTQWARVVKLFCPTLKIIVARCDRL